MVEPQVTALRTGQIEWRIGEMGVRLDAEDSEPLAIGALEALGWQRGTQVGVLPEAAEAYLVRDERHLRDEREKLRANGVPSQIVRRQSLTGAWTSGDLIVARAKPVWASPPPAAALVTGGSRKAARVARAAERLANDFTLPSTLFDDPEEQLRYEVRHAYLMTVPTSQRYEWPFDPTYRMLDQFLLDILDQEHVLSRRQMISVIVDVVCGKVFSTPSREAKPMRHSGGPDPLLRSFDKAQCMRARVTANTPAARRIMWWRSPSGGIELARLATHDDIDIPER